MTQTKNAGRDQKKIIGGEQSEAPEFSSLPREKQTRNLSAHPHPSDDNELQQQVGKLSGLLPARKVRATRQRKGDIEPVNNRFSCARVHPTTIRPHNYSGGGRTRSAIIALNEVQKGDEKQHKPAAAVAT